MNKTLLIILGALIFILIILIFILIKQATTSKNKVDTNYTPYHTSPNPNYNIDTPILTNHARARMVERLNTYGNKQEELMNSAFKYGRTSNRTNGDLKIELEKAESKYDEDSIAKYYNGSIFIFTKEENILKTVYKYNPNKTDYYWH